MTHELVNHLWQSTIFAFAVAILALAFHSNRAAIRHALWCTTSVKFLVPFSLLVAFGNYVQRTSPAPLVPPPKLSTAVVTFTEPFQASVYPAQPWANSADWLRPVLFLLWLAGFGAVVCVRLRGWHRIQVAIRSSVPAKTSAACEVRYSHTSLELGVVGWLHPIILLPAGIERRLSASQFKALMAHELCHARRRDNLTSAIQMLVEAVFWFYPLVWWIGRQMLAEREKACDEEVLSQGHEPGLYAEAILAICRWYVESPLVCSPGIAGADLRKRIEGILDGNVVQNLSLARRILLAVAGLVAVVAPVIVGIVDAPISLSAQAVPAFAPADGNPLSFDVASVKADKSDAPPKSNFPLNAGAMYTPSGGLFSATNFQLMTYIAFAYGLMGNQLQVLIPQLPGWAMTDRYDIQARAAGNPTKDQMRLMMRSLLADRFKFRIHAETREMSVLAYVMAKSGAVGPQLQSHDTHTPCPAEVEPTSGANQIPAIFFQKVAGGYPAVCNSVLGIPPTVPGRLRLGGRNVTIAYMADMFSQMANRGRPMIDATGLEGTFDFLLEFAPDSRSAASPDAAPAPQPDGPTFDEALRDQLGIRMESRRAGMQMIVVDHVERPTEN